MKFHIIENEKFQKLLKLKRAHTYVSKRKQVSNYIYEDLEAVLGRKLRKGVKVKTIISRLIYLSSDRGFCFIGRDTLADKLNVALGTVDNAIKLLRESKEVDIFYRENPKSNSAKTYVVIFKKHDNYSEIKGILKELYKKVWEEELHQKSTESKANPIKQIATLLLQKKQDKKLKHKLHPVSKIIEYITLKVEEQQEKNNGGIIALSSYIDKVIAQEISNVRADLQTKRENKVTGIPFFNWLE
ncbi:hypothetical protein ACQKJC_24755 [Priestia koreensis]|uniref:hypothetical protein n=1 Tax=Priestia koreensis TaxID=284581 RepID=UPI003D030A2B